MRFSLATLAASRAPKNTAPDAIADAKLQQAPPTKSTAAAAADSVWSIRAHPTLCPPPAAAAAPVEAEEPAADDCGSASAAAADDDSTVVLDWAADCDLELTAEEAQCLINPCAATAGDTSKPSSPRLLLRRAATGVRSACRRLARTASGSGRRLHASLAAPSYLSRPATTTAAPEAASSPQFITGSH